MVTALGTIGMNYNNQIEKYTTNFSTLLGSTEKGLAKVEELKKFAAATPLSLANLADATQTLLAFNVTGDESTGILKQLGDIALGNAEKVSSLSRAFGKANALGKLNGEIVQMMVDAGYNPLIDIMETTGETMEEVQKRMSDGGISIDELKGALTRATSEGGKFFNGMEAGSKTTEGLISTLKDNVSMKLGELFQGISNQLKELLPKIIDFVNNIDTDKIIQGVKDAYQWFKKWSPVIAGVSSAVMTLYGAFKLMAIINTVKKAMNGMTIAQYALNVAMNLNPVMLIVTALVGLGTALVVAWNTSEEFREKVTAVWNAVKEVTLAVWNRIIEFFKVDIPNAWNSLVEFFQGIPEWFRGLWNSVLETFKEWGNNVKSFFTETIPQIIEDVFNWFNELPSKIGYALGYALGTIVKWGVDTWNYLLENVPIWIGNVVKWFSELPSRIGEWLSNTLSKIIDWGSRTYQNMKESAYNAIMAVVDWFRQLPSKIWEWLSNTLSKLADFVSDMGAKAKDAGKTFFNNLVNVIKELPSEMMSIGGDIVRGLWNGILNMGSWLMDKVKGFFKGIVKGAKEVLDIHSPSRVFRDEVGAMMAQGTAVGFEREEKKVDSRIRKAIEGTVNVATNAVSGMDANASSTSGIVINQTINSKAVLSPYEIALETQQLQERLQWRLT